MNQARNQLETSSASRSLDDLFPPVRRVIYVHAPLTQVICQLKFPTILRIESEPPVAFQERIRAMFPMFERQMNPFAAQMPAELQSLIGAGTSNVTYAFKTGDGAATLTLTSDSIGITTSTYAQWEEFWDQLSGPLSALLDIYSPSFFVRIGLRYQNAIDREPLGLSGVPWSELLRTEMLGELADPDWLPYATEARRLLRLKTPGANEGILIQHGLNSPTSEPSAATYLIDMDVYTDERTGASDAQPVLDSFRRRAMRAFRWCVGPKLHDAMEPSDVDAYD